MDIEMRRVSSIKADKSQPRKSFDAEAIKGLAKTIQKHGLLQPIEVDQNNVITFGERRFRAAKKAGLKLIPVVVRKVSKEEKLERQLIEDCTDEAIPVYERDKAWDKLWKIKKPESNVAFAKVLGVNRQRVAEFHDRKNFECPGPGHVAPSVISETQGLDMKDRQKLVKLAEKKGIGGRQIRDYKTAVQTAEAYPDIKKDLLAGKSTPEQARQDIIYREEVAEDEEPFDEEMDEGLKEQGIFNQFKRTQSDFSSAVLRLRTVRPEYLTKAQLRILQGLLKRTQKHLVEAYDELEKMEKKVKA